jgi:DNA-binding response OmpR family regulator
MVSKNDNGPGHRSVRRVTSPPRDDIEIDQNMADELKTTLNALRVLVLENDAIIAMLFADVLAEMGHVVCAIEGTEADAVAAAIQYSPDLMIVDAGLSQGNGMSAVQTILRSGFVPHVFVSGNAAAVRALQPAAIIIEKPFLAAELAYAIQRALKMAVRP